MKFYFLLFDQFESLDLFGPVEIIGRLPEAPLYYVSMEGGTIVSAQGTRIETQKITAISADGVLVIPGGMGTRALVKNKDFLEKLKKLAKGAKYVLSVCTGSALLAATGLLRGKRATSNKYAFDWVKSTGDAEWINCARWVHDGKFYTSSGVSAGTDMALGFVADQYGREIAEENARRAEYAWNDDPDKDPFALCGCRQVNHRKINNQ